MYLVRTAIPNREFNSGTVVANSGTVSATSSSVSFRRCARGDTLLIGTEVQETLLLMDTALPVQTGLLHWVAKCILHFDSLSGALARPRASLRLAGQAIHGLAF